MTGALRYDHGKPKWGLYPWDVLESDSLIADVQRCIRVRQFVHAASMLVIETTYMGLEPSVELLATYEYGVHKYARENWRGGFAWSRLWDATARHLLQHSCGMGYLDADYYNIKSPNLLDAESGCWHVSHALWGIVTLLHHQSQGVGADDLG